MDLNVNDVDPKLAEAAFSQLLEDNKLISIATLDVEGLPYSNTAFFARVPGRPALVIFTEPEKNHSRNIEARPNFSATVFDSTQMGSPLRGLQLVGTARRLGGADAQAAYLAYSGRFEWLADTTDDYSDVERKFNSRFYEFLIVNARIYDETRFAAEQIVDATFESE